MRRAWVWFVLLCLVSTVANAQYESKRAFRVYRADGSEVNGDSGAVVAVYPCSLGAVVPDTSDRRVDATWFTNPRRWEVEVDETRAYSFYYRAACCLDTLAVPLECIPLVGPDFVAGAIEAADLADGSALENLIVAGGGVNASLRGGSIGSDSLSVEADTLHANVVHASSELWVQGGDPPSGSAALLQANDAAVTIRVIPLIVENNARVEGLVYADTLKSIGGYIFGDSLYVVEYLRVDGPAWLRGDNTMGTGISNTLTVNGTVAASNDVTASDDMTVTDLLTVNGNATLGNAATDVTATQDLTVADDATVTDVTTLNGAMNLGNATSDALTITADFTAEGDFDVEDSLAVGSDFTAADSTKSALRLNGNLELSASVSSRTFSITAGNLTNLVDWDGLRSNDCVVCSAWDGTTATGSSSKVTLSVPFNGKLLATRDASISTLVLRCVLVKL